MKPITKKAKELATENEYKLPLRNRPYQPTTVEFDFWLNQVLKKPTQSNVRSDDEYGWGGGNSGLSLTELKILNEVVYFEWMGASEFEHGQLGDCFLEIIHNLKKFSFYSQLIEGFTFYIICKKGEEEDVRRNIKMLIVNNQFGRYRSKHPLCLDQELLAAKTDFIGAWEIDHNVLFFIKKEPFEKFKQLMHNLPEVLEIKRLLKLS